MKSDVTINWLVEEVDEHGDIIDTHCLDTLAEAVRFARVCRVENDVKTDIGLVRDRGNDVDGLLDRQWAYVENGKLPKRFSDSGGAEGALVPSRFHTELERNQT